MLLDKLNLMRTTPNPGLSYATAAVCGRLSSVSLFNMAARLFSTFSLYLMTALSLKTFVH